MDENRYMFDKRVVKTHIRKYGLIMLGCLPILIAINVLIGDMLQTWVVMIIDVVVALFIIFLIDMTINFIQNKRAKAKLKEENYKHTNKSDNIKD